MVKVTGIWWKGRGKVRFNLNKVYIEKFEDLKLIIKKKEGAILMLNDYVTLKKEAGAWNYFIKTKKGFKRLRAKNIRKMLERLEHETRS